MNPFDRLLQDYWYIGMLMAFVLGAIVGSFLNVCIARLPLEKSILWPGSRCRNCLQSVHWYDNLPLISYLRLKGRCRTCGVRFSSRYFWIELLTAAMFAGLFWLEVVYQPEPGMNFHGIGFIGQGRVLPVRPTQLAVVWLYHAVFFSFLLAATFSDIDYQWIPLGITIPGTIIGVIAGTLFPWPWPVWPGVPPGAGVGSQPGTIQQFFTVDWQSGKEFPFGGWLASNDALFMLPAGLQRWPVWMPAPDWLAPGTWPMGLATALAGALAGTLMIRFIRFVFSWGFGKEAMGLGDADLMMMIGAFLGWQSLPGVMVFAVFIGLLYGLVVVLRGQGEFAFGPFLAGGAVVMTFLSWYLLIVQKILFDAEFIALVVTLFVVLAFLMALIIRMLRLVADAFRAPEPAKEGAKS